MNFWTFIFIATFAQSIFQMSLMIYGRRLNTLPSKLIFALLVFLTILNLEYLGFSSGFYKKLPHLLGASSGFIFLVGPSIYFYTKSVLSENFKFRKIDVLHLFLFVLYYLMAIPVFNLSGQEKILIIDHFLSNKINTYSFDYFLFALQLGHIVTYIILNEITLKKYNKENLKIKSEDRERMEWLKFSRTLFIGYTLMLFSIYLYIISKGYYTANSSYLYASTYSIIIFILSASLFIKPQIILGNRFKKYKNNTLSKTEIDSCLVNLEKLIEKDKIFTEPELKLSELADYLNISSHNLSQIINDTFDKSFIDYINSHRIKEFQKRILDKENKKLTLVAIAYEVGFNSKSTFNYAFKKHTGLTPSEYKKSLQN